MPLVDKDTLAHILNTHIAYLSKKEIQNIIEEPPAEIEYTYAFPTFKLASHEKKNPVEIAKDLAEKLERPEFFEEISAEGPYVNFRIKKKIVLTNILETGSDYGRLYLQDKESEFPVKRIVIEYPAPNTNKPLHLGHVRNMLIGSTLSRILKYHGHKVFDVNLNNDRGIHICKSMLAYKKWGDGKEPDKKPDHFVGDYYVKYSQKLQEDESLEEEAKELLRLWEKKDPEVRNLWKKLRKWALEGFQETYKKFDIRFDKEYYESDFYYKGKKLILKGFEEGLFTKGPNGAIIAELSNDYELPDKVLLRSDGTSIYITQDIYLAQLKKKDFDYDKSIFIVGNEQRLYFQQLFAVLDILGYTEDKYHLSYGMINLPEGKMKSREGKVVDADDLVKEMKIIAYEEVNSRYPELSDEKKLERAEVIGMAALRFFILKFNPRKDFVFNPEESISFEGETGPYIQYCYARIESIFKKSQLDLDSEANLRLLTHESERKVIKLLNYFPEIVKEAIETYNIHSIPQYLLDLTQEFNSFYSSCPVISDDKELQKARLVLIRCVQIVVKGGLNLLGIKVLKEM
ncbi:MAG: arginine--tRNA ligase [Promethearchaeia archaeon]